MKSCMWTPHCLETAVGVSFDGATIDEALLHLREGVNGYEVAVWILNGEKLESFKVNEIIASVPKLKGIRSTTKVRRIVLVMTHPFGEVAKASLEEELGIKTYLFRERTAAHAWVLDGCK